MINNNDVRLAISHRFHKRELYQRMGEEIKISDLEMTIHNATKIVADEKILNAFYVFMKELRFLGYDVDVIGGEDDD